MEEEQGSDATCKKLQKSVGTDPKFQIKECRYSDRTYRLLTREDKIVLPKELGKELAEWYHSHLLHPGETRLELSLRQHFCFKGLKPTVEKVCKTCAVCRTHKKRSKKHGKLPPKPNPEIIPWHALCIDLIGPHPFGKDTRTKKDQIELWCLTMIDPATGWFEIAAIETKRADYIANYLEQAWLTRYPWPTEVTMDQGGEFAAEVSKALKEEHGINRKITTSRNPQANSIVERVHQVVGNVIRTRAIKGKADLLEQALDPNRPWDGVLAAVRHAVNATVHTTSRATPTQLVFGRDALLNVSFEADWQYVKDRKQQRILHNNRRENATRAEHTYKVGDQVMVRLDPSRKLDGARFAGPYAAHQVHDNGTVRLSRVADNGGAVYQTWNIRNVDPCMA